jgi:hypothetical protein
VSAAVEVGRLLGGAGFEALPHGRQHVVAARQRRIVDVLLAPAAERIADGGECGVGSRQDPRHDENRFQVVPPARRRKRHAVVGEFLGEEPASGAEEPRGAVERAPERRDVVERAGEDDGVERRSIGGPSVEEKVRFHPRDACGRERPGDRQRFVERGHRVSALRERGGDRPISATHFQKARGCRRKRAL